ncbi:replication endonuclease [Terasakiella sp.]|uniref:replication endonuclease n=1 Tax=Terasakiella sp. TaxID=2034861 RepID=UPI003AA8276A
MFAPTAQCVIWRNELLSGLSPQDVGFLRSRLDELDQKEGYVAANTWLRKEIESYALLNKLSMLRPAIEREYKSMGTDSEEDRKAALAWLRKTVNRLHYMDSLITELSGDELSQFADKKSAEFMREFEDLRASYGDKEAFSFMEWELEKTGLGYLSYRKELATQIKEIDIQKVNEAMSKRMKTKEWWIRQIKKQWMTVENVLRECQQVKKYKSPYVSSWSLNKFRQQQHNNLKFLESWEAVNDCGQAFTLKQLSDKGVSNPKNRVAEMAVRSRGMKELAEEMGHVGYLLTLTAPSKYHANSGGRKNPKFYAAGCPSPRDAHKYLNGVWRRFRAWCKREDKAFYGLRTVEPHADGCPHWHFVVWLRPDDAQTYLDKFEEYALQEDGEEHGASEHRFTAVKDNPNKGSIIGYLLKYIQKNLTGEYIDLDHEGAVGGKEGAARAIAWARMHRIRQFQFFGGVSVTVWRELRRLGMNAAPSACLDIYHAANRKDWKDFVKRMGGVFAGRNQTLKPAYTTEDTNQFGEAVPKLKGVVAALSGEFVKTRIYEWAVQRIQKGSLFLDGEAVPWTRVNNCTPPSGGGNYQPTYQ